MAALWVRGDTVRINPGQGGGHQAELEMIGDRIGGTGLAAGAADLLFDLIEACLDLPAGAIVFDDLRHREVQVRSEEDHPLGFAKNPDDSHGAPQIFKHENLIV